MNVDDVRMLQYLQVFYLSVGSLSISAISEGIVDLLQSICMTCLFPDHFPNLPIPSLAYAIAHRVVLEDLGIYLIDILVFLHDN
jgi:hypothetical protein